MRAAMIKVTPEGKVVARCPGQGCRAEIQVPFLALVEPPPAPPERRRRLVVVGGRLDRSGSS